VTSGSTPAGLIPASAAVVEEPSSPGRLERTDNNTLSPRELRVLDFYPPSQHLALDPNPPEHLLREAKVFLYGKENPGPNDVMLNEPLYITRAREVSEAFERFEEQKERTALARSQKLTPTPKVRHTSARKRASTTPIRSAGKQRLLDSGTAEPAERFPVESSLSPTATRDLLPELTSQNGVKGSGFGSTSGQTLRRKSHSYGYLVNPTPLPYSYAQAARRGSQRDMVVSSSDVGGSARKGRSRRLPSGPRAHSCCCPARASRTGYFVSDLTRRR